MTCYKEEIFGPVLITMNVDTLDDVMFNFHYFKISLSPGDAVAQQLARYRSEGLGTFNYQNLILDYSYCLSLHFS